MSLQTPKKIRSLQRKRYVKAKEEPAFCFYLLYDKVRFDFLGYTFGPERYRKDGHWYLAAEPSKKAVRQLRERVRGVLRPGNHLPRAEVVACLNRTLRGWATYFSYGTRLMAYRAVDNYVYDRVRHFLRRRHKVPTRGARRFPRSWTFGELGGQRLRPLHVGRLP